MTSPSGNAGNGGAVVYSQSDLEDMTIAEIEALAEELGYTITETTKAAIIEEFLEQQNA